MGNRSVIIAPKNGMRGVGHPCALPTIDTRSHPRATGTGTELSMLGGGREGARGQQSEDALLRVRTYGVGDRDFFCLLLGFGGSLGGGVFFFCNSCLEKSQIFYKGFFCLFFLQASDGHRVGFC